MKKLMVALSLVTAVLLSRAENYTWSAGETTSGNWNLSENWEPEGVPGGGDTATISVPVTFTSGIVISSGELVIANSAAVTVSGVISGAGSLRNNSTAILTLSGDNAFTGGMYINGNVCLKSATALGVLSKPVDYATGNIDFACANATYRYDLKPLKNNVYYAFLPTATGALDGSVSNDQIDAFYFDLYTRADGVKFTITGAMAVRDDGKGWLDARPRGTGSEWVFQGGVKTKKINGSSTADGYSTGWRRLGGPSEIETLCIDYTYGFQCISEKALCEKTCVEYSWMNYFPSDSCLDLNGYSQVANRLVSQVPGNVATTYWSVKSDGRPATLTLKPTVDSLTNYSYLKGNVSLVMDAPEADTVQIFQGRASTTEGDLVVSNGVVRIADGASFPNVKKVLIAGGGTLDVKTSTIAALGGVTDLTVEKDGVLAVDALAASIFAVKKVALSLETGAVLQLGRGDSFTVASLSVDGVPQKSGSYKWGECTIVVPVPVSPTSTGVWTGGGESTSSIDQRNWEGGYPGADVPVTFATGGTQATLAEDLQVKSVTFTLPASTAEFAIEAGDDSSDAKLRVSGNVVMTDSDETHTGVISVPTVVETESVQFSVGANDTLVLNGPVVPGASKLAFSKTGSGTLYLNATNANYTSGSAAFSAGISYVKGGSLGGTAESPLAVDVTVPNVQSSFYLNGGVFNQRIAFLSAANGVSVCSAEGVTNVVNGRVELMNSSIMTYDCKAGSSTTLNGGLLSNYIYGYRPTVCLFEGAELVLTNRPYEVGTGNGSLGFIKSMSEGRRSDEQNVYLGAKGSCAPNGLVLSGPMKVTFTEDFVFTNGVETSTTPLYLLTIAKQVECDKPTILDLNGHSQAFGALATCPDGTSGYQGSWGDSPVSYVTSDTPATLYVKQEGRQNDKPWVAPFRGAVSLVKSGANGLELSGVSSSAGRLEVAEGRLSFTGNGAWTNVSEVAVSGGILAVSARTQVRRCADYYLSGGKLDIAAGVRLVAERLFFPDGRGGWNQANPGTYTAGNLSECISGGGSLHVRGGGTVLIIR